MNRHDAVRRRGGNKERDRQSGKSEGTREKERERESSPYVNREQPSRGGVSSERRGDRDHNGLDDMEDVEGVIDFVRSRDR